MLNAVLLVLLLPFFFQLSIRLGHRLHSVQKSSLNKSPHLFFPHFVSDTHSNADHIHFVERVHQEVRRKCRRIYNLFLSCLGHLPWSVYLLFFFAVSCLVHISKKKLHLHMYAFSRLYHPLLLYHPAKNVICVQKENICFENKLLLLGNPDGYLTTQKCI